MIILSQWIKVGHSLQWKAAYSRKKCFSNKAISRWPLISIRSDRSSWRAADNDPWPVWQDAQERSKLALMPWMSWSLLFLLSFCFCHRSFRCPAYLGVALLLSSIPIPQLLWIPEGGLRFNHNFLWAFCVRRVRRLGQIHKIVPFLATEADPVQMLPHGGYDEAALYLHMSSMSALKTLEERLVSEFGWGFWGRIGITNVPWLPVVLSPIFAERGWSWLIAVV